MEQFRDLKLIGSSSTLEKLIEKIEVSLCDGWTRARDKEAQLESKSLEQFVFLTPEDVAIPRSSLHLTFDNNGYLYVCNIVPAEIGQQLSQKNYNLILDIFLTKFIEPAVNELDIRIATTPAEKTIDNSMSPELSEKLKRFSGCANQSSGGTHPLDEKRFIEFIVQAHHESSLLDESTLKQLLIDEGWSEEHGYELSNKYRFGRDLLKQYDS